MTTQEIRRAYLDFFADRGHTVIPRSNIVPQQDATTLFTGSGMQPMIPYLLGEKHPAGVRLVNSQVCLRAEDIDEIGDNRHTTYFEMLGNWSLGDYFKTEQIAWIFEFLTQVVKIDPTKLYITCFIGAPEYNIPKDTVSAALWKEQFSAIGIEASEVEIGSEADGYTRGMGDGRIFYYDGSKNWWSRNGGPQTTPAGDPCGPDSEMFYDFGTDHDPSYGTHCHPNCDCGRFMEIGNNVFMSYLKEAEGVFVPLKANNIDHGSGLERIAAASLNDPDVYKISLMWPVVLCIEKLSKTTYAEGTTAMRIIVDHLRAATWMAVDGVVPSNTAQGYVMRRLVRRAIRQAHALGLKDNFFDQVIPVITELYRDDFPEVQAAESHILEVMMAEEIKFRRTLERGLKEFNKIARTSNLTLTGANVFMLSDTYGFPAELSVEVASEQGIPADPSWRKEFDELMQEQKDRSRTATKG
jgi:alanyl-tRNA synthetase